MLWFFSEKSLAPQKTRSKKLRSRLPLDLKKKNLCSITNSTVEKHPTGGAKTWPRGTEATKTPGPGKYLAHEVGDFGVGILGLEMSF